MFLCSICEKIITSRWYCHSCYIKYREDIESKSEWTKFLQNEEKKRRRRFEPCRVGVDCDVSIDGTAVFRK